MNWWRGAAWGSLGAWVGGSAWSEPGYYNYGEDMYYEDGTVYTGDEAVASADEYAYQAEQIATNVPQVNADQVEWMPLGVFAMTRDGQASGAAPTLFIQLAVSKEGIISGTYQNTSTDTVKPIDGMVDKKSQRVAWTVGEKDYPVMETGIYNLTEDTAPALIHFDDGRTQQWLLVRLDEPKSNVGGSQVR